MIKHITNENFEDEVIKSNKVILVDFFATWCGPCQMLSQILEKISNSRAEFDIAKVNVDEASELANRFDIQVVPTMLIFKNGKVVGNMQGYLKEEEIVNNVSKYL